MLASRPSLERIRISDFIEELNEQIHLIFNDLGYTHEAEWYGEGLKYIKNYIITDLLKINDVLKKTSNGKESKCLRAVTVFVKMPFFSDYDNLVSSLDKFSLNEFEKRQVRVFYGALNGMAAFGRAAKDDAYLNRVIDSITIRYTPNTYLVNGVNSISVFKQYRTLDNDISLSIAGYPYRYEILVSQLVSQEEIYAEYAERIRNQMLKLNRRRKNREIIHRVLSYKMKENMAAFRYRL